MQTILKYFPALSDIRQRQFRMLFPLYEDWNQKINVISRKDIGNLYLHHVLHSLSIAKVVEFVPGTRVLDVGTGGGFPGIPLAILFPEVAFHLVDSIGKKIKVVKAVAAAIGLKNISASQSRAEEVKEEFDFVVSRAVTALPEFYSLTGKNIRKTSMNKIHNGILYLKGGDVMKELKTIKAKYNLFPIDSFFAEEYFKEKFVVHIFPH
jgi:16S rRNA (guanine527-N7)-methyltransferase